MVSYLLLQNEQCVILPIATQAVLMLEFLPFVTKWKLVLTKWHQDGWKFYWKYSTMKCNTMQYSTVTIKMQYNMIKYNTIPYWFLYLLKLGWISKENFHGSKVSPDA